MAFGDQGSLQAPSQLNMLLSPLNTEQKDAVCLPEKSALIIAGAGSGKTKVLTSRMAYLLKKHSIPPHGIMAVTFTNKAAKEMLVRLEHIGVPTRGMWVGTFHGICNRFLRRFSKTAGLPSSFQILDMDDSKNIVKRLYKEHQWNDEVVSIKDAHQYIMSNKEEGYRPHDKVLGVGAKQAERMKLQIFEEYESQLKKEGSVDFPELMLRSVELLREHEHCRLWMQETFKHVLIDEFQDTNHIQYTWLKLVTDGGATPVFAVGDDDQSIYAFRGAQVENIKRFKIEFNVESKAIVRLEQNYRSYGNILTAANALIQRNKGRLGKNLWTDKQAGRAIHLKEVGTETEEGQYIAQELLELKKTGASLDEMALLYRTNAQSRALEHALIQAGLPYRVHGGLRFFERAEIKHALAYLRVASNPSDESALLRIINFPARGVGSKAIERYSTYAIKNNCSLLAAVRQCALKEPPKLKEALSVFLTAIDQLEHSATHDTVEKTVQYALDGSGLMALYVADKENADRVDNLKELVSAAKTFQAQQTGILEDFKSPLDAFLAHAALEAGAHGAAEDESAVQMMTVHAAKGLEFDFVFIAGLEEGIFPHMNSIPNKEQLEEERRLMYVALTRAKKELTLTYAVERMLWGQTNAQAPSRFIAELPQSIVKKCDVARGKNHFKELLSNHDEALSTKKEHPKSSLKEGAESVFVVGDCVLHPKFGKGVIRAKSGIGESIVYEIDFGSGGKRKLVALYAKLEYFH